MKQVLKYLAGVFRTGTPESSKRVMGVLMIVWIHVMMSCQVQHPDMDTSLYLGAALLGLETLKDFFRKPKT